MLRKLILVLLTVFLVACATATPLESGMQSFDNRDYKTAFEQLYPVAMEGDPDAQYAVGYMLYYGKGVAVNKNDGMEWIRKSAKQGNSLAEQALGIVYEQANFAPEKTN